jgi:hypothetical protein
MGIFGPELRWFVKTTSDAYIKREGAKERHHSSTP